MLIRGDEYFMAICNKTGTVAIYNSSYNLFLSPFADGPIKFAGTLSNNLNIENISKYGRSFSIVRIPYAFKLLLQELQAMNVQLRLITEENIDQLTNLSFSNNIEILTGKNISDIVPAYVKKPYLGKNPFIKFVSYSIYDKVKPPVNGKLVAETFLKFKLPKLGAMPPLLAINDLSVEHNVKLDAEFKKIHEIVNAAQKPLDKLTQKEYNSLSAHLDLYGALKNDFKANGFPFATNASVKMYELIKEMDLIDCTKEIKVFCDAELPGAFITTIHHFIKTNCLPTKEYDWVSSSYYPEAASAAGDSTILEDKYGMYSQNREHWLMGPRPNALLPEDSPVITGDLLNSSVVRTLSTSVHTRFSTTQGATLATSDAGIDVSGDYANQERDTALLNYGQILAAILSLAPGGHLVTKQFTFNSEFNRSLIALVTFLFAETYITKPVTSRPGNSEIYLVAKGFTGISPELTENLLNRLERYSDIPNPFDGAPFLLPVSYVQIDEVLLQAATEIHLKQQVAFLNEIDELYQKYKSNLTHLKNMAPLSQKFTRNWLKKYPLLQNTEVIPWNETVGRTTIGNTTIGNTTIGTKSDDKYELQQRKVDAQRQREQQESEEYENMLSRGLEQGQQQEYFWGSPDEAQSEYDPYEVGYGPSSPSYAPVSPQGTPPTPSYTDIIPPGLTPPEEQYPGGTPQTPQGTPPTPSYTDVIPPGLTPPEEQYPGGTPQTPQGTPPTPSYTDVIPPGLTPPKSILTDFGTKEVEEDKSATTGGDEGKKKTITIHS
jgi:hypothetical protein